MPIFTSCTPTTLHTLLILWLVSMIHPYRNTRHFKFYLYLSEATDSVLKHASFDEQQSSYSIFKQRTTPYHLHVNTYQLCAVSLCICTNNLKVYHHSCWQAAQLTGNFYYNMLKLSKQRWTVHLTYIFNYVCKFLTVIWSVITAMCFNFHINFRQQHPHLCDGPVYGGGLGR